MRKTILCVCICFLLLSACAGRSQNQPDPSPEPIVKEKTTPSPENTGIIEPDTASATPAAPSETKNGESGETAQPKNYTGEDRAPDIKNEEKTNSAEAKPAPSEKPGPVPGENEIIADTKKVLNEKVICIDPGHGNPKITVGAEKIAPNSEETKPGTAYGAQGVATKVPEYVVNMQVSLKLKEALEAYGCKIVMTRMSDEENMGNIERALIGNEANSDMVIRIHADGSTNKDVHGVSVLYPGDKYIKDKDILEKSKKVSQFIHDAIVEATRAKPRGIVKREDLTGFNWSTRPVTLIEMGFMSNPDEDRKLSDPDYQDKIVQGIVRGLIRYFESIS